jgi:hypothetical protein
MTTLWTTSEVARALEFRAQTVRVMRAEGLLPAADQLHGNRPLWYPATIVYWALETGRLTPDGQTIRLKPGGRPRQLPRCPTCDQALPSRAGTLKPERLA